MLLSFLTQFAGTTPSGCNYPDFFGLKPWYYYLQTDNKCNITNFEVLGGPNGSDFVLIALVLIDDLLRIIGFIAVGYIIYGGILYTTSQGAPDQTTKAKDTIINAIIGLFLAIVSVAFVTFLGNRIG